jgi:GT2 family glycosyltransferase
MERTMISLLVLVRDTRASAASCLQSLLECIRGLGLGGDDVEFIVIDDCSNPVSGIPALFADLRAAAAPVDVRIVRFRTHRHYAYGMAVGLSMARGATVFFVSHDMIVPPACLSTLLAVSASAAPFGIIRPISGHMDCTPQHQLEPPAGMPLQNAADVAGFARRVARDRGLAVEDPPVFIGDAMLVRRDVIDRVGVFDTQFFGFMADVDYGLRARRAGFRVVSALGAWLYHAGSGFRRSIVESGGAGAEAEVSRQILADAAAAWDTFRRKWHDAAPPAAFAELDAPHFQRLARLPRKPWEFQPPVAIDPEVCEVL